MMRKRTNDVILSGKDAEIDFTQLLLPPNIVRGLKLAGFEKPSPIQLKAIPLGRTGVDIIAQAKSGTGKTCVFSVLTLAIVDPKVAEPQAIVMAPTRELAAQSAEVIQAIGSEADKDIRCVTFIGGLSVDDNLRELRRPDGCHIIVATPGRLCDIACKRKALNTSKLKMIVLDEADRIAEEPSLFRDTKAICDILPQDKQVLAFSATFSSICVNSLSTLMKNPQRISLISPGDDERCAQSDNGTNNTNSTTEKERGLELEGVSQFVFPIEKKETPYAQFQEKARVLSELLDSTEFNQCLVFCSGRAWGSVLSDWLSKRGWRSSFLGGGRDVSQKERLAVMEAAKNFQLRVLVSTDLISRGVDIERVNMVVNFDMPSDIETYFHRIGRTGRFGTYGVAVNFMEESDITFVEQLETHMGHAIRRLEDVRSIPKDLYAYEFETKEERDSLTELKSSRLAVQLKSKARDVSEEMEGMKCLREVAIEAQKREAESQIEREKKKRRKVKRRRKSKGVLKESPQMPIAEGQRENEVDTAASANSWWWTWWYWNQFNNQKVNQFQQQPNCCCCCCQCHCHHCCCQCSDSDSGSSSDSDSDCSYNSSQSSSGTSSDSG